jgi:hypothetical protein
MATGESLKKGPGAVLADGPVRVAWLLGVGVFFCLADWDAGEVFLPVAVVDFLGGVPWLLGWAWGRFPGDALDGV